MLESFVSSRIRRTLLEYILAHPTDRFYLRGLSKELSLSVSPLRRELKRLEQSGMITAVPEGNMLFYTVNLSSAAFHQLVSFQSTEPKPARTEIPAPAIKAVAVQKRNPVSWQDYFAVAASVLLVVSAVYVGTAHRRLSAQVSRLFGIRKTAVTVVIPAESSSGVMRGGRWRVVPGGFGGGVSSANSNSESY